MKITDEMLEKAKKGDQKLLELIISNYKGFIYMKAKNFFIIGAEKSDVIQEATIGLFKAIKSYDKDKMSSFNSFASLCIQRHIITAIRSANSAKKSSMKNYIDLEKVLETDKDVCKNENPEEIYVNKFEFESLSSFLQTNLSILEQDVFGYLVSGYDYKEISELISKDLKSIDNAIQRIRKKSLQWIKKDKK